MRPHTVRRPVRAVGRHRGRAARCQGASPVAFPCALVDISYTACQTLAGGAQRVRAQVTVRVAFQRLGPSSAACAPQPARLCALSRFDTLGRSTRRCSGGTETASSIPCAVCAASRRSVMPTSGYTPRPTRRSSRANPSPSPGTARADDGCRPLLSQGG